MKRMQKKGVKRIVHQRRTVKNMHTHFYFLVRSWNAYDYFDTCIDSIFRQNYKNYTIIFIDDASEYTIQQRKHISEKLKKHICIFNAKRKFPLENASAAIKKYCTQKDGVVFNLDGDDWLPNDGVLTELAKVYAKKSIMATYGDCYIYNTAQKIFTASATQKFTNIPYPNEVISQKSFRLEPFYPLHPLTWRVSAFLKIPENYFKYPSGDWLKYCQDLAIFFPLLEQNPGKVLCLNTPLYVYNKANFNNTNSLYITHVISEEIYIRKMQKAL